MKFSERKKYKKVKVKIQIRSMTLVLRNILWNILYTEIWESQNIDHEGGSWSSSTADLRRHIWGEYFGEAIDFQPKQMRQYIRDYYFKCKWYEVYDFIEFVLQYLKREQIQKVFNLALERNLSGYRFVNGVCTEITKPEEIEMLEAALNDNDFPGVVIHLRQALILLSNKKNPDYRNSIKESISAVESAAKVITRKTQ